MKATPTSLPGVLVFEPEVHADARGWLFEAWKRGGLAAHGLPQEFVQQNVVRSEPGVLRGLHLQHPGAQGKLVFALEGEVFDVAVDVRAGSPTFGRWEGTLVSMANKRQVWIPPGFAHGYAVVGAAPALLSYLLSAPYRPEAELTVRWDDPDLAIRWPVARPLLSARDGTAPRLKDIDRSRLPVLESAARPVR